MIVLVNPRATRPANRRFPLSAMAIGAALPDGHTWTIVDGNLPDADPLRDIHRLVASRAHGDDPVRAIAMTVMPGPQLVNAVPLARHLKTTDPEIPIIWGGYFPSLYPQPVLRSGIVDWIVRGQGEQTMRELLDVLDGQRDPATVAGLGYREGTHIRLTAERRWAGPAELPPPPYDRIPVAEYLRPSFLGRRGGVYQASIGCPYHCNFCGVISVFGSREKVEPPARTAEHLEWLVRHHGMDAVHFYDNNFFLAEAHAVELAERLLPLNLSWWCEARIDAMLRFSDATWRLLRRAGLRMVFFGAESGSDEVLRRMAKRLTTAETLEVAARARTHDIIPEFSFVLGGPEDPETEIATTLAFIRRLKDTNPAMELITYFYTPTPQRRDTYGNVDPLAGTPDTLSEWTQPAWVDWMTHENPLVPWLNPELKARVDDFTLVLRSRFPSVHDRYTRRWGKWLAQLLARSRWRRAKFTNPQLLRSVHRMASLPRPDQQAYGHLRPPTKTTA